MAELIEMPFVCHVGPRNHELNIELDGVKIRRILLQPPAG